MKVDCRDEGFTLLEMLVAMVIVGLVVTTFFQLFGASLRLESRSRGFDQVVYVGEELFSLLRVRDLRRDDFPWSGERANFRWDLKLEPVSVKPESESEDIEPAMQLRWPSEIYRLVFHVRNIHHPGRHLRLVDYLRVTPGYFTDDFKKEHLVLREDRKGAK